MTTTKKRNRLHASNVKAAKRNAKADVSNNDDNTIDEITPTIELLDHAPAVMSRPLVLISGKAYAATWLPVQIKDGKGSRNEDQRLIILASGYKVFGLNGNSISALPFDVHLPEIPLANKLISTAGVQRWQTGDSPNPTATFKRIAKIIDRFIDFDRSLAAQSEMCELAAAYVIATYMLPAFSVFPYCQTTGERGSGKTQLLNLIGELAYLGQVILSGGSYATLRDLADYGATLCFDDAESIMNQKFDPDKRALLLAGNRRGASITVKEPINGKGWRTRYINAFCPRLFSAIRLPDPVLASRTIVIPLLRTPDRQRANADALDYKVWPHDRRDLLDDLWLLALRYLPDLPKFEDQVSRRAKLMGRDLEPWKPLLTVALWLDKCGTKGLYKRFQQLSVSYQTERHDLEVNDLTVFVIRALLRGDDVSDVDDLSDVKWGIRHVPTEAIVSALRTVVKEVEADVPDDLVSVRRVGRIMAHLRFKKSRTNDHRGWIVDRLQLQNLTSAYGLSANTSPGQRHERQQRHNVTQHKPRKAPSKRG